MLSLHSSSGLCLRRLAFASLIASSACEKAGCGAPETLETNGPCGAEGVRVDKAASSELGRWLATTLAAVETASQRSAMSWHCGGKPCEGPGEAEVTTTVKAAKAPVCYALDCSDGPDGLEAQPLATREKVCTRALFVPLRIEVASEAGGFARAFTGTLISRRPAEGSLEQVFTDDPARRRALGLAERERLQETFVLTLDENTLSFELDAMQSREVDSAGESPGVAGSALPAATWSITP